MKLSRFTIGLRGKLVIVFSLVAMILVIGAANIIFTRSSLEQEKENQHNLVEALNSIKKLQQSFSDINLLGMDVIVDFYENPESKVVREEEFKELKSQVNNIAADSQLHFTKINDLQSSKEINSNLDSMLGAIDQLILAINTGVKDKEKYAEFDVLIDTSKEKGIEVVSKLQESIDSRYAKSEELTNQLFQTISYSIYGIVLLCLGSLLGLGFPIVLTAANSVSKLQSKLSEISKKTQRTSDDLSTLSQQLAGSSTQAAAAIQESVSAMTEMSAMLAETSRNAVETSQLSKSVMSQAKDGVSVMGEMSESMQNISRSSQRLKEIVNVIENIASKTNVINDVVFKTQLLAVNASIEAARAGHHGKGFAVVANEVASLAALSGKASTEIRDLLSTSATHVTDIIEGTSTSIKEGERTCEKSTDAFESIAKSVETISDRIEQISSASKEQEAGVSQTSTALGQMNQATNTTNSLAQRNASLGSQIKSVSEHINLIDRAMKFIVTGSDENISEQSTKNEPENTKIVELQNYQNQKVGQNKKAA